ncbi:unnamed protein product [Vicia faba]|uniref:Reverse transcriptase domain-containing protein n=1 Tax=Vicia faba TaxID=3906 RepID=A0AAV1AEJ2_VICFA|nr:unnamed protein product [Vicia faba]
MFKADFEKAYDSVDWKFLDVTIERIGFDMKRGLRQWDHISPFLFVLVAEGLNVMMVKSIQMNLFDEYEVGKEGVKVSPIQYVDNTIIV